VIKACLGNYNFDMVAWPTRHGSQTPLSRPWSSAGSAWTDKDSERRRGQRKAAEPFGGLWRERYEKVGFQKMLSDLTQEVSKKLQKNPKILKKLQINQKNPKKSKNYKT
jgi:hypothetical protein